MKEALNKSVVALSHTPQYKMHKYFARRPYNVFSNIVEHYTEKGQIILDPFCGGGVTVFEGVKLERNVIGVDLNPLAAFITRMQMFNGNLDQLIETINNFVKEYVEPLSNLYFMEFNDDKGYCTWIEWAYVVKCPTCGSEIVLTENNKIKNGVYKSNNSSCSCHEGIARTKCIPANEIPVRIKYFSENHKKEICRTLTEEEQKQIIKIETELNKKIEGKCYPVFEFPMNWDRQKEDKLFEKGIVHYEDLFSKRNMYVLSSIFEKILELKNNNNKYADYLYFIFSSTLRYSNKMSKVTENWEGGNPTCMDKHAYYLPNVFIENNVVNVYKDRANSVIKGCSFSKNELPPAAREVIDFNFNNQSSNYRIINCSSDSLPIENESIDIVITDPPYGSNVQYAELSVVWNAWFQIYANKDKYIYRDKEAVSNRKSNYEGAKNELDYEHLLYGIYKEAYRVLKNDSFMVFTFNNKNLNVWLAMLKAVAKSGFVLADNGVLFQDFISSYKNTSHLQYAGNVQGDFIYTFVKTNNKKIEDYSNKTIENIIDESIDDVISHLFSVDENISSEILYKELFVSLASKLMKFIQYKENNHESIDDIYFEEKSVDSHLNKKLIYENQSWKKRS